MRTIENENANTIIKSYRVGARCASTGERGLSSRPSSFRIRVVVARATAAAATVDAATTGTTGTAIASTLLMLGLVFLAPVKRTYTTRTHRHTNTHPQTHTPTPTYTVHKHINHTDKHSINNNAPQPSLSRTIHTHIYHYARIATLLGSIHAQPLYPAPPLAMRTHFAVIVIVAVAGNE